MPQFAANLTMLFTEHPFLDRFEHAAKAGARQSAVLVYRRVLLADLG